MVRDHQRWDSVTESPPKIQIYVPSVLVGQDTDTRVLNDRERFIRFGQSERTHLPPKSKSNEFLRSSGVGEGKFQGPEEKVCVS